MKLIDTSSWIEYLRGSKSDTAQRTVQLLLTDQAAWCELISLELWNGVTAEQRPKLEKLEKVVTSLKITDEAWLLARRLAIGARSAAITVPVTDIIVFACARTYGLELEHHEDGHFEKLAAVASLDLPIT